MVRPAVFFNSVIPCSLSFPPRIGYGINSSGNPVFTDYSILVGFRPQKELKWKIFMKSKENKNNFAFIDSQNLNLSIRDLGWKLDFKRFRKYLVDKYNVTRI